MKIMAELTIITETGMFHSACRCTYGNTVEWYGFAPVRKGSPLGPGAVHRDARDKLIKHSISFDFSESFLRNAINTAVQKYATKTYIVSVVDCVSFSADVARNVGLAVPLVNITPYGLIQILRVNSYTKLT
jgi:hypothetical protein